MHTERKPLTINAVIIESDYIRHTVKSVLGCGGTGITYKCLSSDGNSYCLKEVYPTELADFLVRQKDGRIVLNPIFEEEDLRKKWDWYQRNLIEEEKKQRIASIDMDSEANDPYFIKSYGTFTAYNGNLYARYDMKKGHTLAQLLEKLSPPELLSVLITACKKLDKLHKNKKLLHLDLSPSNIYMIDHACGKEAYFLDFGSALSLDNPDESSHRFSATEGYSAQEVLAKAEGNQSSIYRIGKYSDTYSLVAILFRALVGNVFCADYRLEPHLWMSKVHAKLNKCGAGSAENALIEILRKGLAEKDIRYQSANELFDDLCAVYNIIKGNDEKFDALINDIDSRIEKYEKIYRIITNCIHKDSFALSIKKTSSVFEENYMELDLPLKPEDGQKMPLVYVWFENGRYYLECFVDAPCSSNDRGCIAANDICGIMSDLPTKCVYSKNEKGFHISSIFWDPREIISALNAVLLVMEDIIILGEYLMNDTTELEAELAFDAIAAGGSYVSYDRIEDFNLCLPENN